MLVPWLAAFGRERRPRRAGRAVERTPPTCSSRSASWNATASSGPTPTAPTTSPTTSCGGGLPADVDTPAGHGPRPHRPGARTARPTPTTSWPPTPPATPTPAATAPPAPRPASGRPAAACASWPTTRPRSSSRSGGARPATAARRPGCPLEMRLIHMLLHPGLRLREPGELRPGHHRTVRRGAAARRPRRADSSASTSWPASTTGDGATSPAPALLQRAMKLLEAAAEPDIEPLLEGARCLAYLEIDMERTSGCSSSSPASTTWPHVAPVPVGAGPGPGWAGRLPEPAAALQQAIDLATARGDHWATFECTRPSRRAGARRRRPRRRPALVRALGPLAARLGDSGSEAPSPGDRRPRRPEPRGAGCAGRVRRRRRRARADRRRFLVPDSSASPPSPSTGPVTRRPATAHAEPRLRVARSTGRPLETAGPGCLLACLAARRGGRRGRGPPPSRAGRRRQPPPPCADAAPGGARRLVDPVNVRRRGGHRWR